VAQASELGATAVDGAEEVNASAGGQLGMATEAVAGGAGQAVRLVVEVGTGLAGLLTVTILSVLLTFFFLRDGAALWRLAMTHTRASAITPLTEAGRRSIDVLGGYMIGTGAISVVGAFSQLVIMWLLNLPLALPVFVLSFFGGFIPYIGSALTTLLALLIAIAVGDPIDIVIMLIWTVVFNIVQGNIVAPIVYGRTAHIHPAIVLAAIPAASSVAGIAGMFIVVPAIGVVAASWRSVLSILSAEPTDGRRGDPAHDERSEIDDEPADEAVPQPA
jgi:predicted PurR-regulated permease PerM